MSPNLSSTLLYLIPQLKIGFSLLTVWMFSVCALPPHLTYCISFAPPDAHAIFFHKDSLLLCNWEAYCTGGGQRPSRTPRLSLQDLTRFLQMTLILQDARSRRLSCKNPARSCKIGVKKMLK